MFILIKDRESLDLAGYTTSEDKAKAWKEQEEGRDYVYCPNKEPKIYPEEKKE